MEVPVIANVLSAETLERTQAVELRDIAKLFKQTGRGGPGSGEVWHHLGDYNRRTREGTVVLMDQATHAALAHIGGSAQARADIWNDPDKKAKYGIY